MHVHCLITRCFYFIPLADISFWAVQWLSAECLVILCFVESGGRKIDENKALTSRTLRYVRVFCIVASGCLYYK